MSFRLRRVVSEPAEAILLPCSAAHRLAISGCLAYIKARCLELTKGITDASILVAVYALEEKDYAESHPRRGQTLAMKAG